MAEAGVVISCYNVHAWMEQLQKGIEDKKLIVVDFTAPWCGPCRTISPILTEWARRFPQVTFLKVDVDVLPSVATDWAIEAMPTFVFLKEGNIVDKVVGARKEELLQKITMHVAKSTTQ